MGGKYFPELADQREAVMFDKELEYWGIKRQIMIRSLEQMYQTEPEMLEGASLKRW
jgi:hypothetical protein